MLPCCRVIVKAFHTPRNARVGSKMQRPRPHLRSPKQPKHVTIHLAEIAADRQRVPEELPPRKELWCRQLVAGLFHEISISHRFTSFHHISPEFFRFLSCFALPSFDPVPVVSGNPAG